jgi:hypothetical protein
MHVEIEMLIKPTAEGVKVDRVAMEDYFSEDRGYDNTTNGIFCDDGSMILMCARNVDVATNVYGIGWNVNKAVIDAEYVQKNVRVFEVRGKVVSA